MVFLNDADAAGIAEMRWGAGKGVTGTAIMLTFGTGIGSALFANGRLFPNTELGHLELNGMDAEKFASAQVRTALQLDFPAWIERVNVYLARMHALFWPDVIILGGAVSERYAEFSEAAQVRGAAAAGALCRTGRRHRRRHGQRRVDERIRRAANCPTWAPRSSRSCRAVPANWAR